MEAQAPSTSPRSRASCPGSSAARNARASAGSQKPRRASTLAVVSLTARSRASAATSSREHGRIVHVPVARSICENGAGGVGRYPRRVPETNYVSGDDYVVEFLEHRFGFNALDFEQRVGAAAVKLGLVERGD